MGNIQQARVDFCRCIPINFVGPKKNHCKKSQAGVFQGVEFPVLKLTAKAPENGWLEYDRFLLGLLLLVSGFVYITATGISRHHSRWQRLEAGLLKCFMELGARKLQLGMDRKLQQNRKQNPKRNPYMLVFGAAMVEQKLVFLVSKQKEGTSADIAKTKNVSLKCIMNHRLHASTSTVLDAAVQLFCFFSQPSIAVAECWEGAWPRSRSSAVHDADKERASFVHEQM